MLRWILAIPFFLLWGLFVFGNIVGTIKKRLSGDKKSFLMIPWLGGIAGCVGLFVFDWKIALHWFWVPLLLDIGSFFLMSLALSHWLSGVGARLGDHAEILEDSLSDADREKNECQFLAPDNFLIREVAGGIIREDWQNLCLWMLEHGNDDPVVIDVAANGMEDWQSRLEDVAWIRQQAGIGDLTESEKLKRIEAVLTEQYRNGGLTLSELIRRMEHIWLCYGNPDDFMIWFELAESLDYYDHGKGTLIHRLNPLNPLKSAEKILRKYKKL